MKAEYFFILTVAVFVAVVLLIYSQGRIGKLFTYFKSEEGRSPARGWKIFIGVPVLLVILSLVFCNRANADIELYLGADDTIKASPQCEIAETNWSQTLTSNGGFRWWVSEGPTISYALQYSHASCALNQDRNVYDAIGPFAYINIFTPKLQFFAGKEYMWDHADWVSVYGIRGVLLESSDGRASLNLKYTQRDFGARKLESENNFKGFGAELNFRF